MRPLLALTLALLVTPLPSHGQDDDPDPIREKLAVLLRDRQPDPWDKIETLPGRAEIEKQLAELDKKQDADAYLPLALNYLARKTRGEKFSYHLWRAAAFAEWVERAGKPIGEKPLFPALLEIGDQLEKTDPYYFESRFLRAVDLSRKGDLKGQRRIIMVAMEEPTFPENFIPSFKSALAESLEKSGETEKAIRVGASLVSRIDTSSKACDAVLRTALLALESGDRKEGINLIRKVSGAPYATRKGATSADLISEFANLILPLKGVEDHWAGTEKWWPEWEKLEEKLKLPPAPVSAPLVIDTRAHRRAMTEAAAKGDVATYFRGYRDLAHAARWLPSAVSALTDATSLATRRLRPDIGDDFRRFMVAVHREFSSKDPDLQRRHEFYYAVYLLEIDRAEDAIKVVEEFGGRPQKNDALSQGMLQLWALCSQRTGADLTGPTRALEDLLDADEPVLDRPSSVKALAQLYSAQGKTAEEEILLERELEHPSLKANPDIFETLTRRHQALSLLGGAGAKFGETLGRWKAENLPPWFEFAEPKSLDDPKLADLETVLRDPLVSFSIAESVKLRLLVASSEKMPLDRRYQAFIAAAETLLAATKTHAEYDTTLSSILDLEDFPSAIRVHFLWRGILEALNGYSAEAGAPLTSHPLVKRLPAEQKDALATFQPFFDADPESAESLWKLYETTSKKRPLSRGQVSAILEVYGRILQLGEIEKAEAIYEASESFTVAPDVNSKESFRMNMLRILEVARKTREMNRVASEAILGAFPPDKISRPDVLDSLRSITRLRNLPENQAREIQLYLTKTGIIGLATSEFWHDFIRSFGGGSEQLELSLKLVGAMVDHAPANLERSITILRSSELIDADDQESLKRLLVLLEPLRKPDADPLIKDALAILDLGIALRTGKEVDVEPVLNGLKHPVAAELAPRIRLRHYLVSGNTEALKKAVEALPPNTLLKRTMLPLSIPALRAAGLDAELKLATERARIEAPRAFIDSWFNPDSSSCLTALRLAELVGDPKEIIPQGWLDSCLATIQNRRASLTLEAEYAQVVGDWESALSSSSKAIESYPTYYHFYWLKGKALHELGRDKEAAEALKVFVRYAKDEEPYPEALEILKEIAS